MRGGLVATRITALLMSLALVASACGSGDEGSGEVLADVPTSTTSTTTTTTTPVTTTATVPEIPLPEIPDFPVPEVDAAHGGPMVVETYCQAGSSPPNRRLEAMFEFMGVSKASEGCDVTIGLDLVGERQSALYTGEAGWCFTGYTFQGEVWAEVDEERWSWEVDVVREPPDRIRFCDNDEQSATDPLPTAVTLAPLHWPLHELFGALGDVAFAMGALTVIPVDQGPPDEQVYDILAAALHRGTWEDRCRIVGTIANLEFDLGPQTDEVWVGENHPLFGLVPHLIASYSELPESFPSHERSSCVDRFHRILGNLTGEEFARIDEAAAWAEWWLGREEAA